MIQRLNMVDRIMMPVLALTSLLILVGSYVADNAPILALWGLAIAGFAYVLYQAIRIGSPLLTALTAAAVMVGYLGPAILHWRDVDNFWSNNIWDPLELENCSFVAIALAILVAGFVALPIEAGVIVAWIVQRRQKSRQQPHMYLGGDDKRGTDKFAKSSLLSAAQTRCDPVSPQEGNSISSPNQRESKDMQIYIHTNGRQEGPFPVEEINQKISQGFIAPALTMAWYQGCPGWMPLLNVPGVSQLPISTPPPLPTPPPFPPPYTFAPNTQPLAVPYNSAVPVEFKRRAPAGIFPLMMITCGVYLFVWVFKIHKELATRLGPARSRPPELALGLCLMPLVNNVWLVILMHGVAVRANEMLRSQGLRPAVNIGGMLSMLIIAVFFSMSALVEPLLALLAVPLLWIVFAQVQAALNQAWQAQGLIAPK
jgi:hypothetical protein